MLSYNLVLRDVKINAIDLTRNLIIHFISSLLPKVCHMLTNYFARKLYLSKLIMEDCRVYPEAAKIGNKQGKKTSLRQLEMYM